MLRFQIVALAMLLSSTADARLGCGWGGQSIVVVEAESGAILRNLAEANMGDDCYSQVEFEWGRERKTMRISWTDVFKDSTTSSETILDVLHHPQKSTAREIEISVSDLSTRAVSGAGPWENAVIARLDSAQIPLKSVEPELFLPQTGQALQIPDYWEVPIIKANDIAFIVRGGTMLDAFDAKIKKKLWSLDLNPERLPLAGPDPEVAVLESGDIILVASDRLGLRSVGRASGKVLWHLDYLNAEVIPNVAAIGKNLIVGPVERSYLTEH